MYIYRATVLCLAIFSCGFSEHDRNCIQFRRGDFVHRAKNAAGQGQVLIHRNDSIQTETNTYSGESTRLSIKWTGECTYELKLIESTFRYPDSVQQMRKAITLKTEILAYGENYYIFKTSAINGSYTLTDTLWVNLELKK